MAKSKKDEKETSRINLENLSKKDKDFLTLDTPKIAKKYQMDPRQVYSRKYFLSQKIKSAGLTLEDVLNGKGAKTDAPEAVTADSPATEAPATDAPAKRKYTRKADKAAAPAPVAEAPAKRKYTRKNKAEATETPEAEAPTAEAENTEAPAKRKYTRKADKAAEAPKPEKRKYTKKADKVAADAKPEKRKYTKKADKAAEATTAEAPKATPEATAEQVISALKDVKVISKDGATNKPIEINFDTFSIRLNGIPKKIAVNPDTNAIEIDL